MRDVDTFNQTNILETDKNLHTNLTTIAVPSCFCVFHKS